MDLNLNVSGELTALQVMQDSPVIPVIVLTDVVHAVLVARTDAGEFVLDNLRGEIITREKSDYHFISMQDGSRRLGWVAL